MKVYTLNIILILIFISSNVHAQQVNTLADEEMELAILGQKILNGQNDIERKRANEVFTTKLEKTLNRKGSFDYPFDSIKTIARLTSPDQRFKIFNWHIPLDDGTFEYYGFLQVFNKAQKKYDLYKLTDKSNEIRRPETKTLTHDNWFGAHYYKIIVTKYGTRKFYTLLGWDGNDLISNKKLIDVLTLTPSGKPKFGYSLFKCDKKRIKRYFYEYKKDVSMSLKYEQQYLVVVKTKDKKNKYRVRRKINPRNFNAIKKDKDVKERTKRKKKKMIVFDHLIPMNPSLKGMYNYYVPESNVFDAFIFENGKWRFYEDVDARNAPNKNDIKKPNSDVNYDLLPKKENNEKSEEKINN